MCEPTDGALLPTAQAESKQIKQIVHSAYGKKVLDISCQNREKTLLKPELCASRCFSLSLNLYLSLCTSPSLSVCTPRSA